MSNLSLPKYFPSGNTCQGYYSLFKYIMPKPERSYILTGGLGCGKSYVKFYSSILTKLSTLIIVPEHYRSVTQEFCLKLLQ